MANHAYLSASSSARWLRCPPSAKLCAQEEDKTSPYAQQGTDAHSLAAYRLEKALGRKSRDPTEDLEFLDAEMDECADGYAEFCLQQIEDAKKKCPDPLVCIEQTVDFSKWVEHGFGTADCLIVADSTLHVIDLKYGIGVLVSASGDDETGNSQLKLYALGALDTFGDLYDISTIKLSIYQPRRENVDTFVLSVDELLKWADEVLCPIAKLAYEGLGEFEAGDHCQFCKVKSTCRKRAEYNLELEKYAFALPPTLDDQEIAEILPKVDSLLVWAQDIKDFALNQAISGVHYSGFKLVEGRSNRKYTDEVAVARLVSDAGYEPYEKKLLGITQMTKQLGKKRFETLLGEYVIKPEGKPVLVPESDSRPALDAVKNIFLQENLS